MKFIIIGLGNPGKKYERTRHNAGFAAVDELSRRAGIDFSQEKFHAFIGKGRIGSHEAVLAKPQTYMNESGRAVAALLRDSYLGADSLIVLHDELDLPLGTVRVKVGGGHGGHNGLRSLIEHLGTPDFVRIRIGIGRPAPGMDAADYVLSPFSAEERSAALTAVDKSVDALLAVMSQGIAGAMNLINPK
jgi:PTH1 family peptidyl-tRNA hydrolase